MKKITLTSYRESLLGLLLKMIYGKRNQNPFLPTSRVLAGSRQRTLCGNLVSSRGSSNCPSATPPLSSQVESSWDVLCVAAGEIARFLLLLIFEICVEFFVCTSVKILTKVSHVLLYWSVSFLTLGLSCFVNDS
ncbi:hypothetical protein HanLR1_Chr17g0668301 [Helianthus annuus]|nr:hypothetical protein HanHA89_Chr17g0709721 [Helianthus annuus]KAJ0632723.1 hypothetical protein HanLR1_Chr17g0668301 [Helianthus annuus]